MGYPLKAWSPELQRQISAQLTVGRIASTAPRIAPLHVAPPQIPHEDERALQSQCEDLLVQRRYCKPSRRSFDSIVHGYGDVEGWYVHLDEPQGNPQMPDLLIWDYPAIRPPLCVELKVRPDFQPGQKDAITAGAWKLAYSLAEFTALLDAWESASPVAAPLPPVRA